MANLTVYDIALAGLLHRINITDSIFSPDIRAVTWIEQCLKVIDHYSTDNINIGQSPPLYSIFKDVSIGNSASSELLLQTMPMGVNACFPVAEQKSDNAALVKDFYTKLQDAYTLFEGKKITSSQYIDAVDSVCAKYLWCIPHSADPKPTESIYQYNKIAAGLAVAVFSYYQEKGISSAEEISGIATEKSMLLVGGDLSGIQDYIFELNPEHSKHASKTLRARSFKVKILCEIVLQRIITDLGLTRQCVLMNAGGKFMLLAPNTDKVKDLLSQIRVETDKEFFDQFIGRLNLNLSWESEVCLSDFKNDKISEVLTEFLEYLDAAKSHKYASLLQSEGKWNTQNFIHDSAVRHATLCKHCGRRTVKEKEDECLVCEKEIKLGKLLPDIDLLQIVRGKCDSPLLTLFNGTDEFRWHLVIYEPENDMQKEGFIFRIKDSDFPFPLIPVAGTLPRRTALSNEQREQVEQFSSLAEAERAENKTLTFDELAVLAIRKDAEGRYKGVPYNSVLKGDVDNLGAIFEQGLKDYSLNKFLTLSATMDYFFSVYVPALIDKEFNNLIYTVYAGGDDFCLIGPWNTMLDFVIKLKEKFAEYTGNHTDLHFSASLTLMHAKEPVRFAINTAEEDLSDAKAVNGKNALKTFETVATWEELSKLIDVANDFDLWFNQVTADKQGFNSQFLYRLIEYHEMNQRFIERGNPKDLLFKSYIANDLKRNFDKAPQTQKDEIVRITSDGMLMSKLKLPITKVLYQNRKYNK